MHFRFLTYWKFYLERRKQRLTAAARGQVLGQHLNGRNEPKLWLIAGAGRRRAGLSRPVGQQQTLQFQLSSSHSSQTAGHLHKHATCLIPGATRWSRPGPDFRLKAETRAKPQGNFSNSNCSWPNLKEIIYYIFLRFLGNQLEFYLKFGSVLGKNISNWIKYYCIYSRALKK